MVDDGEKERIAATGDTTSGSLPPPINTTKPTSSLQETTNPSQGSDASASEQEAVGVSLQPVKSAASKKSYEVADTRTKIIIVIALCANLFLSALDQTIVSTALPAIVEDLGNTIAYSWVGSSYLIASSAFIPSWGKFSDIWGRKPIILVASAIFLVGSIATSAAQNMGTLIAGRTVQGLGGGGIVVLVNITISDIVTTRERGKYLAAVGSTWALASAIGPILGGAFASNATWRWCFIINIPIGVIAMIIITYFLRLHSPKIGVMEGLKQVDWLGTFLAVVGTTLFLTGLDFGGVSEPWDSPLGKTVTTLSHTGDNQIKGRDELVLCCLIIGGVLLVVLIFVEWKFAANPIMPPRVFGNRTNAASYMVCFLHAQVFIAGAFYIPLYFQASLGKSALMSGVLTLPFVFMLSVGSIATGIIIAKTGKYRPVMQGGLVLTVAGIGTFVDWDRTSSYPKIVFYQFIAGLGLGPMFQSPLIAIHSTINPQDIGVATGAFSFIRNLAGAIGVSLGTVIFANEFIKKIPSLLPHITAETAKLISGNGATSSTGVVRNLPDSQRIPIQDAYAASLSTMWWYFFGISCAALLSSLLVGKHTLSTKLQSVQPVKARKKTGDKQKKKKQEEGGPEVESEKTGKEVGNDVV
ncbi:hypothetical protein H072_1339 [Dactylellina haptotyla CBS 200.50]|uniref:Major facilitator superfamily (MFS) profile domain-containing protein n=1 Tax=Dactylellina haptotyla (strain CBS 200.50) TaxID=1284197 RepID=S8AUL9_DACHA|nr:hypothetical protein H072_1339 [Dactylellina haptotyla CBS 200.50]